MSSQTAKTQAVRTQTVRTEHKPGVHEEYLKRRRLRLERCSREQADLLTREIDRLLGVDTVDFDGDTELLTVEYDASVASLDQIEAVLSDNDCAVSRDLWTRFREGWYRFNDDNIKQNASRDPWTCHNPPK